VTEERHYVAEVQKRMQRKKERKEKKRKEKKNGKKEGSRFIGRVLLSMLPP